MKLNCSTCVRNIFLNSALWIRDFSYEFIDGGNPIICHLVCVPYSLSCIKSIGTDSNYDGDSTHNNQVESRKEMHCEAIGTNNGESSSSQVVEGRASWNYRMEEIDPSVVDELPPEIQQEVRAWLRPLKRPNVVKRGSITHYFSSNKSWPKWFDLR